jgi:asparagine synthase (glutamine-hydrolysing)
MCGIAGIFHFDKSRAVDEHLLKKMTDIIKHRGPDGEGFYISGNIGLGHRRLSIIDLNTGDQPMFNHDKSIALVLNGEIYNYIELKEELKEKGHVFTTSSDTEVVIKAYEEWGVDCQNKFNGMWAFALWDNHKQLLFLSRDRIGEKPLHYAVYDNSLVFGSEMKSLFAYGIPRDITLEMLEVYLVMTNIPEPFTFYKHIKKLQAGYYIIVTDGSIKENKYWDLPEIDESNMLRNKSQVYENFSYLLEDSVKIRMRSDVAFGAFLSGGLDSSSIVALMSEISPYQVNTFTIGFDEKAFDESSLAADVARKFGTNHHRGTVTTDDFNSTIERIAFHYDEPFGDSSAIPVDYVSRYAAEKVKMVLTGDGGDEVLSGYSSYQGIKLANIIRRVPLPLRNLIPMVNDPMAHFFKGSLRYKMNKASSVIRTANLAFPRRIAEKTAYTDFSSIKDLTKDLKNIIKVEDYMEEFIGRTTYKNDFYKLMYLNFKYDLPNDYLVKVDRMSMANSLETRVPFLDYRLIEYMVQVDKDVKMQGWERKSVLRNTIGKKLPAGILSAPKKGFGIPLREWFKENSFENTIDNNLSHLEGILDFSVIDKLVRENRLGHKDNGNFIWTLMMLNKLVDK